jgi:hypothetical protein
VSQKQGGMKMFRRTLIAVLVLMGLLPVASYSQAVVPLTGFTGSDNTAIPPGQISKTGPFIPIIAALGPIPIQPQEFAKLSDYTQEQLLIVQHKLESFHNQSGQLAELVYNAFHLPPGTTYEQFLNIKFINTYTDEDKNAFEYSLGDKTYRWAVRQAQDDKGNWSKIAAVEYTVFDNKLVDKDGKRFILEHTYIEDQGNGDLVIEKAVVDKIVLAAPKNNIYADKKVVAEARIKKGSYTVLAGRVDIYDADEITRTVKNPTQDSIAHFRIGQ